MAEFVGGAGVPHTPHFPGIVDRGEPLAAEIASCYEEAASVLRRLRPDVLIFFTCDHYYNFFTESIPIFSIGVAESARGPGDYRELRQYEVPMHAPLARRIQAHLVQAGFDAGMSQEFELDHPVTVPLHFLTPEMNVPIVRARSLPARSAACSRTPGRPCPCCRGCMPMPNGPGSSWATISGPTG